MTTKARHVSQIVTAHRQRRAAASSSADRPHLVEEEERVGVVERGAREGTRRQAMSYSMATLLPSTLHDVFGENDPARGKVPRWPSFV